MDTKDIQQKEKCTFEDMKVAFAQYDIVWESPSENFSKIEALLGSASEDFDLLLLPEMFGTGFSMDTLKNAELMDGKTIQWMKEIALRHQAIVSGSVIIKDGEDYYNRLIWMKADGSFDFYDKRHLFTLAKEHHYFSPGKMKRIFEVEIRGENWKICPQICYDLRFPVWSRNIEDYDILFYVSNFPEKREFAWSQLLIARAIENQSYVIGVNRIGVDGVDIPYSGQSKALRYDGRTMIDARASEGIFYVNFSKEKLTAFRRAYGFLKDRDQFTLH